MAGLARGRQERLPDLLPGERTDALSIAALYGRVQGALARALPRARPIWVRGEIQSVSDRTGHCYIDLVDPDGARGRDTPVLKVTCWSSTWTPLKASLDRQGIVLEPGTVVTLQGRVELYAPRGQLNFVTTDIDVTALLGRLAARRAALLKSLESGGLLRLNQMKAVPEVPLVVGLVASRGTEGHRDFMAQIEGSNLGFKVLHVNVRVQGAAAPRQIVTALESLFRVDCDLVVMVRGGGSKGDLAVFDTEPVARAVATAPVPIWTGIGHTGDQSVADIVANRAFVTPTECGQELVGRVSQWWSSVAQAADFVLERSAQVVADASVRDVRARSRLCASARNQLERHGERVRVRSARLVSAGPRCTEQALAALIRTSARISPSIHAQLQRQDDRVLSWRRLLAAYDVERQLERGYTITLDQSGNLVRSADGLVEGAVLVTRFADGRARSRVEEVVTREERPSGTDAKEPVDG